MALSANTILNIPGNTQTITFNNPGAIDEYDFGSNTITLKAISSYTLSKTDFELYVGYLIIYYNALLTNFPNINSSFSIAIPASEFDFKVGSTRITYDQHSGAADAYNFTYLFSNTTVTVAARASDVNITLQEFFTMIINMRILQTQVSLN